jgi:predicted anti-sigma-YlaC factor YlaD
MKFSESAWCEILKPAVIVGMLCILTALWALRGLDETYGKDLDYTEPV